VRKFNEVIFLFSKLWRRLQSSFQIEQASIGNILKEQMCG